MTEFQMFIMVALAALATQCTRWTPFLLFRRGTPSVIRYLGSVLPSAIWGMLVVYCFKSGTLIEGSSGIPEILASLVTLGLQQWKRNMAVSISGGTVVYIALIQHWF